MFNTAENSLLILKYLVHNKKWHLLYPSQSFVVIEALKWPIIFFICQMNCKKNGLPRWCSYVIHLIVIFSRSIDIWLKTSTFLLKLVGLLLFLPLSKIHKRPTKHRFKHGWFKYNKNCNCKKKSHLLSIILSLVFW